MPTYVYRFLDCDGTIEVQQAFTDTALTEALNPADGRVHPVKKVVTPVGLSFKGDGFYKTDNRGKSGAGSKPAAADASAPSSSGSSSESSASTPVAASTESSKSGASESGSNGSKPTPHSHPDHAH